MFILKHVIPLVIVSLLLGFVIAQVDLSSLVGSIRQTGQENPAAKPAREDGQDWSVDAFVDTLRRQQSPVTVDSSVEKDIAAQLSEAANRAESGSKQDPYLSSILEEANDLSVTAVPTVQDGVVRNNSQGHANRIVTVQEGESLIDIAARVYGYPLAYQRIFEANRDVISDPDKIFVGQRLRIPD